MNTKQMADGLTFLRIIAAVMLVWLGWLRGISGLRYAIFLLLLSWTSDAIDGPLARYSRRQYRTWIGDHDLEIDMIMSCGLLGYMIFSGYISVWVWLAYATVALVIFWLTGFPRSLGMLFQAPIYGWFIWIAYTNGGWAGWLPFIWIATAVLVTWPRFPKKVVPEFIQGVQQIIKKA